MPDVKPQIFCLERLSPFIFELSPLNQFRNVTNVSFVSYYQLMTLFMCVHKCTVNKSSAFKMAPQCKQMTPEEKQIIIGLIEQGFSRHKIAEMTEKNRKIISKFLKRYGERGSEENIPRTGRKKNGHAGRKETFVRLLKSDRVNLMK